MPAADTLPPSERTARLGALRVAAVYGGVALAWILGSDFVVSRTLAEDAGLWVHVVKGAGFVVVTTACLYIWTYHELVRRGRDAAWLRLLVDQAPDLIFRYRLGERPGFDFINSAAFTMVGYRPEEYYADPALGDRLIHPEDEPLFRQLTASPGDFDGPVELRCVHRNGSIIWVEIRLQLVEDVHGVMVVEGIARDVTARRRNEERTRLLATAVEASGDAVMVCDPEGVIRYVNPAFTALSGYSPEEAIGQTPRLLKSGRQPTQFYKELWSTVKAGRRFKGEFVNRRKDGTLYTQQATITPVMDEAGGIRSIIAVARDVTVERRLEEQLRRAQMHEMIGRMASGTAHDFKNFLSVIELNAGVARDAVRGGRAADAAEPLEEIAGAARRGADLVRRLLALGRSPDEPDITDGDIAAVLEGMRSTLRSVVPSGTELSIDVEPDLPRVSMNATAVEQIVLNLVSNAAEALEGRGHIVVRLHRDVSQDSRDGQGTVHLSVRDDGPGIPDHLLDRVFEPFFTTRARKGGSGLGLAMVRALADQQGASLRVDSRPGRGTTFTLGFAAATQLAATPARRPARRTADPDLAGRGERVLLVDDELPLRRVLERILTQLGYDVVTAGDGVEAQARLVQAGAFDVVVTDLQMPRAGGIEVYRRARELGLSSRFLFMSGEISPDLRDADFVGEGALFLEKPYTIDQVSRKMREVLGAA